MCKYKRIYGPHKTSVRPITIKLAKTIPALGDPFPVAVLTSLYRLLSLHALSLFAVLFKYHEEHQYPIHGHCKLSCRATEMRAQFH